MMGSPVTPAAVSSKAVTQQSVRFRFCMNAFGASKEKGGINMIENDAALSSTPRSNLVFLQVRG